MAEMTKHQRRLAKILAKKEARAEGQLHEEKKEKSNKLVFWALVVIVAGVLIFFAFNLYSSFGDGPMITLISGIHDFGQISQAEGTVTASLSLKNEGLSDLIITNMVSSCSCTSAVLVVDGVESPVFGMHSNYPDWSQKLVPGQEAELRVKYDPNVHNELRGQVTRTLTIYSNDLLNSPKQLTINAYQVD